MGRKARRRAARGPDAPASAAAVRAGPFWLPAAILALIGIWAFLLFSGPLDKKSNDFFWHLTAGREIVSSRGIAAADPFSHSRAGEEWTNFEWLFQAGLYLAYSALGAKGVIFLKALALVAQAGFLFLLLRRLTPWFFLNASLVAFWVYVLQFRDYLRPETLSYLFMTSLLWKLFKVDPLPSRRFSGEATVGGYKGWKWTNAQAAKLAVFFALWANIHGAFVYGLAVLFIWTAASAAEALRDPDRTGAVGRIRGLLKGSALSAAACLLNPYGWKVFWVPFEHVRLMAVHHGKPWEVMEWKATPFEGYELFWAWVAAALLFTAAAQIRSRKFDWAGNLILAFAVFSAARYVRNAHLFVLVSIPIVARQAAAALPELRTVRPVWSFWVLSVGALALAGQAVHAYRTRFDPRVYQRDFPVRACDFLVREGVEGNLKNSYTWGGFVEWRLYPRKKVFMDSRYLFTDILKEEHLAKLSEPAWKGFLERYGITHAIEAWPKEFNAVRKGKLDPKVLKRPPRSELMKFYPPDDWALVFWDTTALIFVRRGSGNDELIRKTEYGFFRADDYLFVNKLIDDGKIPRAAVQADIKRNLDHWGRHPAARFFADFFQGQAQGQL